MAKKNITIGFPEEKLNVLLYFLNREQQNLEPLLEEQLDRLYNRTVPKQTRDFIQFQLKQRKIRKQGRKTHQEQRKQ